MGSVDAVIHRLEQQLRKYKEKVQERHRNSDPRRREASDRNRNEEQEQSARPRWPACFDPWQADRLNALASGSATVASDGAKLASGGQRSRMSAHSDTRRHQNRRSTRAIKR